MSATRADWPQWESEMSSRDRSRPAVEQRRSPLVVVIGIGNPYRRDDGVGPHVAARLRSHFAGDPRVAVCDLDGEPVRLMQAWEHIPHVVLVDAVQSGASPGTIHRTTPDEVRSGRPGGAARAGASSGHAMGLADALELAAALDRVPEDLVILGVEGASFDAGVGLTPIVADAAALVVGIVAEHVCTLVSPQWGQHAG